MFVNDTITRTDIKEKIFEAKNTLTVANLSDYANLHGVGGHDHARKSGIFTSITDYSEQAKSSNNGKALTVGAMVSPVEFGKIKAVCEFNLGEISIDESDVSKSIGLIQYLAQAVRVIVMFLLALAEGIGTVAGYITTGKLTVKDIPEQTLEVCKKARKKIKDGYTESCSKTVYGIPLYKDYNFSQQRVNPYTRFPDGSVKVSTIQIQRTQYKEQNGALVQQKKPWNVRISTFHALPKNQPNGTVSYIGSSVRESQTVNFVLDDDTFYEFCNNIEHFVNIWEIANCVSLVQNGLKAKAATNAATNYEN